MKRSLILATVLVLMLLNSPVQADTWTAQATSPNGGHSLYSDFERVFLVDNITGTAITLDLPGIYSITWMDAKSALMNRGTRDIFIVDLHGTVFYIECYRNGNPDRACGLTPEL